MNKSRRELDTLHAYWEDSFLNKLVCYEVYEMPPKKVIKFKDIQNSTEHEKFI